MTNHLERVNDETVDFCNCLLWTHTASRAADGVEAAQRLQGGNEYEMAAPSVDDIIKHRLLIFFFSNGCTWWSRVDLFSRKFMSIRLGIKL